MKLYTEQNHSDTYHPGEVHLHIRFRPASLIGILLVLILHGLLLYFLLHIKSQQKKGDEAAQSPLVLFVDKATALKMSKAEQKKAVTKTARATKQNKPITPVILSEEMTSLPPPPDKITPPELDMSTMLNAARERRRATQEVAENQEAQQGSRGMSPQEAAEANVKRSMQQASGRQGSDRTWEIRNLSIRTATVVFYGWNPGRNQNFGRSVEVDAGLGGDIKQAVIRRIIEIMRERRQGSINWQSKLLGRTVTLSAQLEDNAELEIFLMREFFGSPGQY